MTPHILIVVSLVTTTTVHRHDGKSTRVAMQEFDSVEMCRAAASEIKRQNAGHGTLRMSCVPKAPGWLINK